MKSKFVFRNNSAFLNRMFQTILLAAMASFALGQMIGIESPSWQHMAVLFLTAAFLAGFGFAGGRSRVLLLIVFLGVCVLAAAVAGLEQTMTFFRSYGKWLLNREGYEEAWCMGYTLLNAAAVTLPSFGIGLLFEKFFSLKKRTAVVILFSLIIAMAAGTEIPHLGVVFCILFLAVVWVETVQRKKENREAVPICFILPFLLLYLFFMCLMPSPKEPYDWQFVRTFCKEVAEIGTGIAERIQRLWGDEEFDIAFAGFSEEAHLSGINLSSEKEVMTILPDERLKTNIYLTGKIFDTFENGEWIQTNQSTEKDRLLDNLETVYAIKRQDAVHASDYLRQTVLTVRYEHFDTGYLFAPIKSYEWSGNEKVTSVTHQGGNLLFNEIEGYGTEYAISYNQMNVDHPGFYAMLKEQQNYPYGLQTKEGEKNRGLLNQIQLEYRIKEGSKERVTEEELQNRAEQIRELYGKPVEISKEVQDYLAEITKDDENEIEKLKSIEEALSQMVYTTSPGRLPGDKEFLDYFLLESGQGYCSYFATAFVLLARAEGIPARYVQGFCIPGNGKEQGITVKSSMAHAWPEAYIEGVGWIPFEPTPSYGEVRYTPWEMHDVLQSTYGEGVLHYETGCFFDYQEKKKEMELLQQQEEEQKMQQKQEEHERVFGRLKKVLGLTVLIVAAGGTLFILLDVKNGKRRYEKLGAEEKLRQILWQNLSVLTILGYERKEGETLSELRFRVRQEEEEKETADIPSLSFFGDYEEAVYGEKEITDTVLVKEQEERKMLLKLLKEKKGKVYFYYRMRLYLAENKGWKKERKRICRKMK